MTSKQEIGVQAFEEKIAEIYNVAIENNHTESSLMIELDFLLNKVQKKRVSQEVINDTIQGIIHSKTSEEVDTVFNKFIDEHKSISDHRAVIAVCSVVRSKYRREGWEEY